MSDGKKKGDTFCGISHRKPSVKADIVLALGLLLILAGLFLMVKTSVHATRVFALRPAMLLCAGFITLYLSIAVTGNSYFLFSGIVCVLMGIIFLLMDTGIISYGMKEMWPTLMISCGLALFPSGLYRAKRIRTVYLFPAILLVLLGTVFLLFSLHIVPFSFAKFVTKWWPLLIILSGAFLVTLFFVQQANSKQFPYMEDDSLDNGEYQ